MHTGTVLNRDKDVHRFMTKLVDVFDKNEIKGEIISTIPLISAYIDNKIHPNFFSNEVVVRDFEVNSDISYMVYSPSSFWCSEEDIKCKANKNKILNHLIKNYNVIFYDTLNNKEFFVFSKDKTIPSVNISLSERLEAAELSKNPLGKKTLVAFFVNDIGSIDRDKDTGELWKKENQLVTEAIWF